MKNLRKSLVDTLVVLILGPPLLLLLILCLTFFQMTDIPVIGKSCLFCGRISRNFAYILLNLMAEKGHEIELEKL